MQDQNKIFERFSPFIREYIYKNNWTELREVQLKAANVLFNTENNLIISSATASGKTEAAFFPILSMLSEEGEDNFTVLYIAPLKALINDQYSRLEYVLEESGIPVFHWHGDVPQAHKEKYIKNPKGILQITPESLESMLINRKNDIPRIFARLRFIVIDEIHTLMGFDRGNQTRCIIERISRLIGYSPRRIGLSATMGDTGKASEWLGNGSGRDTDIIDIKQNEISWRLAAEHFFAVSDNISNTQSDEEPDVSFEDENEPVKAQKKDNEPHPGKPAADYCSEFVYDATKNKKCIIFSNSREETEHVTATMRRIAEVRNEEDRFYIHHGFLSAAIREEAESALKRNEYNTACATMTLELGIDIGRLERIINMESPNTVTGFLQRIGRSGRRGAPSEMLMVFNEEPILPNAPLYRLIPWQLLQAIAIIQLYIEERFIEPPFEKKMPVSLLFHQTLSLCASGGAVTPKRLAQQILSMEAFKNVSREDYRDILVSMIKRGFLELTEEKELIVGLNGERLTNNFKFYAVFKDSEDFTVRQGSEEIGMITSVPPVGDRFALAGRVWEVEETDLARKLVYVHMVKGKMDISWPGDKGEIHTRILERMRRVIEEDTVYPYLLPNARARLEQVRALNRNTEFTKNLIVPLGNTSYVMFPWFGTKSMRTLKRFLKYKCADDLCLGAIESDSCYYLTYKSDISRPRDVYAYVRELLSRNDISTEELTGLNECPVFEKYDEYLPAHILRKAFYTDKLDMSEIPIRFSENR